MRVLTRLTCYTISMVFGRVKMVGGEDSMAVVVDSMAVVVDVGDRMAET